MTVEQQQQALKLMELAEALQDMALNAGRHARNLAQEAARASESSVGFTQVAVRTHALAQRTAAAAREAARSPDATASGDPLPPEIKALLGEILNTFRNTLRLEDGEPITTAKAERAISRAANALGHVLPSTAPGPGLAADRAGELSSTRLMAEFHEVISTCGQSLYRGRDRGN